MRVTCERCLRRYDVPDATVKGRKIRARCKCGARVVVQDEERAAKSVASGGQTTGSIQRPVRWFVDITSWEPIAMDLRQLVRAFDAGRIDADTLVWRKGMPDWSRLREVAELAERLIGADPALKNAGLADTTGDIVASGSEPPPRQSERSRTPPATYTVEPQAGAAVSLGPGDASMSPARAQMAAATMPGGARGSRIPSDVSAAPRSSRNNKKGRRSSRPDLPTMSAEPRTITQTGLAAPPDTSTRVSSAPPPPRASVAPTVADDAATRPSTAAMAAARARDSRSPTPAGGLRRAPSSDETPAQKPSSISVPPGAMTPAPARPRTRRLVALAAVVLGGALLVQRFMPSGSGVSHPAGESGLEGATLAMSTGPVTAPPAPAPAVPVPAEPPRAEVAEAAPAVQSAAPTGTTPHAGVQPPAPVVPPAPPKAVPTAVPAPERHPPKVVADLPGRVAQTFDGVALSAPAAKIEPALATAQPTSPSSKPNDVVGREEPGASSSSPPARDDKSAAAAPPAPGGTNTAPRPSDSTGVPVVSDTPPPAPPSSEVASPNPAPAPVAPATPPPAAPRPFEAKLAEQQMGIAAWKASTCGQTGQTRGSGEVSVLIESWGRVVRVTHMNQAFVGTPVGLCVMQAYQQVRVPPFDGTSKSLTGSFVVE